MLWSSKGPAVAGPHLYVSLTIAHFPVDCRRWSIVAAVRSTASRHIREIEGGVREHQLPLRAAIVCAIFAGRASAPSSARLSPSEGVVSWLLQMLSGRAEASRA